jgi:hypothetical protein
MDTRWLTRSYCGRMSRLTSKDGTELLRELMQGYFDRRDDLVDDEHNRYDRGIASVTEHLVQVETWITASLMS